MKRVLLICTISCVFIITAKGQRPLKSGVYVDGFYATTFDIFLDSLISQHNLHIVFNRENIKNVNVVERFEHEPLKSVLSQICKANDLHYWVEFNKTIYIINNPQDVARLKKTAQPILIKDTLNTNNQVFLPVKAAYVSQKTPQIAAAAPITKPATLPFSISGRIVDQVNGQSLPSAVIRVHQTNISATANIDGYFTILNVPADTCQLDVSYIGYQGETFALNPENIKSKITIGLFAANKILNEVVVTDKKSEGIMNIDKRSVSVLQI